MKVNPINNNSFLTVKNTGYTAATALTVATISGYSKNKMLKSIHKPSAILSVIFTILHIGILESYKHKKGNRM